MQACEYFDISEGSGRAGYGEGCSYVYVDVEEVWDYRGGGDNVEVLAMVPNSRGGIYTTYVIGITLDFASLFANAIGFKNACCQLLSHTGQGVGMDAAIHQQGSNQGLREVGDGTGGFLQSGYDGGLHACSSEACASGRCRRPPRARWRPSSGPT